MTELTELLFPVLETVPKGCITYIVPDNAHYPHLRPGDWAVVDTAQREIESGALYLIQQMHKKYLWQINQIDQEYVKKHLHRDEPCYWLNPLNKKTFEQAQEEARRGDCPMTETPFGAFPILDVHLSDGPIPESGLRDDIIGRVIGVFQSTVEEAPAR